MDPSHQEIARCLFRESNDALFIFDPKDHRVLDINPAALRLSGLDKKAACALRLHELFRGEVPGSLERMVEAYRRTGFYHSREGYTLTRPGGAPIPVNVSVSRIHTEPEPLGLVVARDITERIQAQESLRESEARYRGLVERASVVIWSLSAEGRIESLNPAFEAITGWPCPAWIGRDIGGLIHPDDRPVADDAFARAFRGEPVPTYELRVRSAAGEFLVLEFLSASLETPNDRTTISGIARDVTQRRRVEEALGRAEAMRMAKEAAEAADRAKGEFLGHISHEIRTPMTSILGFTDLLLEDERIAALPDDLIHGLRTIKQSGVHLLHLINDILDLSKIEASRLVVHLHPCSPTAVAEDIFALIRPWAESKGLGLVLEAAPDLPASVRTDAVRLRQILINLLGNAIKFTLAGEVRLAIGPGRGGDRPSIRFEVVDSGVGIPESDLGRLFEPFYTSDHSHNRASGAGLGLAISRRLAELLGGRIAVDSRPGTGSRFTLELPADPDSAIEPTPASPRANPAGRPSTTPFAGERILLAEDNESIRRFLLLRLQQAGAEVAVAPNGQEAVDLALGAVEAGRPFGWILMDVQMPVLDGYGATRELRARGYSGPIVALTAFATDENRDECLRFGCDDHLSKPIDWDRLVEILARLRAKAQAPDEIPRPLVG